MRVLAIDIGSTTIKAAVVRDGRVVGRTVSEPLPGRYDGVRAEVDVDKLWSAVATAVERLGARRRNVDVVSHCCLCPGLVGLDRRGRAVAPMITHQDRRSVAQAKALTRRLSKREWLAVSGNLPIPGGISATSMLWLREHAPEAFARVRTFGHVSTYLAYRLTGSRVIDPSNAAFTGLYETTTMDGWSSRLCRLVGVKRDQLPEIQPAEMVAGKLKATVADRLGLAAGLPVLTGIMDTSAAILAGGSHAGQLTHAIGTTNVMAVVTDRAHPHSRRLTRPLGTGESKWLAVYTLAAGAGTLAWLHRNFYADLSERQFFGRVSRMAREPEPSTVAFEPHLAGDRMQIDQPTGAIGNLTLGTDRDDILRSAINGLAQQTADGLSNVQRLVDTARPVTVTGGGAATARLFHTLWPGEWRFRQIKDATLRGLCRLATV